MSARLDKIEARLTPDIRALGEMTPDLIGVPLTWRDLRYLLNVARAAEALGDFMETEFIGLESWQGSVVGSWHPAELMVRLEDELGEALHRALEEAK